MQSTLFYMFIPILCALPYGESWMYDCTSSIGGQAIIRGSKKTFVLTKMVISFLNGATIAVLPLLFDFALTSSTLPAVIPKVSLGLSPIGTEALMGELFYWFLFHGYLFFLIGFYPANEMYLGNGQPLVRTASRTKWIISKQINLFVNVVVYYGCFLIFMLIGNCIHGGEIIPENRIIGYCGIPCFGKSNLELFTAFILLPLLMSVAVGQIQILMSLFISPVISLMITIGYMVASVFWMNPLFIGNYSMLLRQDWISGNPDISVPVGVVVCMILIFATSFAGIYMFQRKDILPSE